MAIASPLLSIQTPQLIGICCGISVFVGTIITVGVLFVKGGSIERLRAEANGTRPARPRPKLVDDLLEAAARLEAKPELGTATVVARTRKGEAPRRIVVRRAAGDKSMYMTETLAVVDASLAPEKIVGAMHLVDHRPRHLAVRLDGVHGTCTELALFATVDALFARGYRRVEWRALEAADATKAEACGFALEGILRKYCIDDGASRDARLYALLNTDWRVKRPALAARLDVVESRLDAAWTLADCVPKRKKNT